jgi:predicted MPP superfamily phosphohydrolase
VTNADLGSDANPGEGKMQVFTSSGAGTWGPPLRLGSNPEIVMLEFE